MIQDDGNCTEPSDDAADPGIHSSRSPSPPPGKVSAGDNGNSPSGGTGHSGDRPRGSRFEVLRMKPHDHIGWVFSGPGEFHVLAEPFLAEGASRNERLMYVAEDPVRRDFGEWTQSLYPGTLTVTSIAEVYGPSGIVDASKQRATFAQVLTESLAEGYSGIRVAADNTPLVLDQERLASWVRWESVADHFMAENQVTGLCAFDRTRIDVERLRDLAALHPLGSAEGPKPPFRLFTQERALWLEGVLTPLSVGQAELALESLPARTDLVVAVQGQIVASDAFSALRRLTEAGVVVTVRGATAQMREVGRSAGLPGACFS